MTSTDERPRRADFWRSLPGILTGVATLITAALGVFVFLESINALPFASPPISAATPDPTQMPSPGASQITLPSPAGTVGTQTMGSPRSGLDPEVMNEPVKVAPSIMFDIKAKCEGGKVAVGGGSYVTDRAVAHDVTVFRDSPDDTDGASGWQVQGVNKSTKLVEVVAFAVCVSPAGLDRDVHTDKVTAAPNAPFGAKAKCEGGKVAVGGGNYVSNTAVAPDVTVFRDWPDDTAASGWQIQGINKSTKTVDVIAYAVCVSPARLDLYVETKTGAAIPSEEARAQPRCPDGKIAIGGGSYLTDSTVAPDVAIFRDSPVVAHVSGWDVFAMNKSTNIISVNAYAICASP